MKISTYIFELLQSQDCVIVPNFGAFVARNISAKISSDGSKIFPPNKELSFNKNVVKNKKLEKQKYIEIKNIGSISLENSKYIFIPNQSSIFLKSSYGFNSIDSSYIIRQQKNINNSYLKYAAMFIVFLSLTGLFTKSYFDSVNEFNKASYAEANLEIEKKIQKATFNINASLPVVKLPIRKQYGSFHIVAGSFRLEENSLKMISQLKDKGFIESRKVGVNKFGLIQVAYNSYDTVEEARIALSDIRAKEDINAWLLIKN